MKRRVIDCGTLTRTFGSETESTDFSGESGLFETLYEKMCPLAPREIFEPGDLSEEENSRLGEISPQDFGRLAKKNNESVRFIEKIREVVESIRQTPDTENNIVFTGDGNPKIYLRWKLTED